MSRGSVSQMKRWVQNAPGSIKRSLSSTTTGSVLGSNSSSTAGGANYYNGSGSLNKQWVHPPDVLNYGRVEYTVKMLGEVEVSEAKGTEVIKEAIQKLRFNFQVRKSVNGTSGSKLQKVELHISVDGVGVVDPKTGINLYKYPLHQISFCADDKQDKRVFSFIAKSASGPNHNCFVFLSEKLAEEITLTIGEAFDLAYRKFLNNNGRDLENKKQVLLLKKRVTDLEAENALLKQRLEVYEGKGNVAPSPPSTLGLTASASPPGVSWESFGGSSPPSLPSTPIPTAPPPGLRPPAPSTTLPPPLPRPNGTRPTNTQNAIESLSLNGPSVGKGLENLQLDGMEDIFDDDFNPRAGEKGKSPIRNGSNPSSSSKQGGMEAASKDPFGLDPFITDDTASVDSKEDGAARYRNGEGANFDGTPKEFEEAISMIDDRLAEIAGGFERGLGMGKEGDLMGDFDPLPSLKPFAEDSPVSG